MRITFLTGCLEAGKDGVGDYTRLLAQECSRLGASCQVIALADHHVDRPAVAAASEDVELLRLPARMSWRDRADAVAQQRRASDWVSVQFVPFSYQRWGVARAFVRELPRLTGSARLHVMFHEIWIGPDGNWRRRLISMAQRRAVLRLCRRNRPLVHTSNGAYQRLLDAHGVEAGVLPLFGSIPTAEGDAMTWLGPQLAAAGCDAAVRRHDWWLFVLFGTLHPVWPPEPLIAELERAAHAAHKRVALISVGHLGAGATLWDSLDLELRGRIPMVKAGEQPDWRIAEVFNAADFGIATTPYGLLSKSATATAMLEHGLPLIVNREDGFPRGQAEAEIDGERVIRLDAHFRARLATAARVTAQPRRREIATRFLAELTRGGEAPR